MSAPASTASFTISLKRGYQGDSKAMKKQTFEYQVTESAYSMANVAKDTNTYKVTVTISDGTQTQAFTFSGA